MVISASPSPSSSPIPENKNTKAVEIPTIDLSCMNKTNLSKLLVEACEEFGFFKIINHGVPEETIKKFEEEGIAFFAKPCTEKEAAGFPNPCGYGVKNIGANGDKGEIEYLLLQANPTAVSEHSKTISSNPAKFSCAMNDYVEAMQKLACEILDLTAEGLPISDKSILSRMVSDVQNDAFFRFNYYPPLSKTKKKDTSESDDPTETNLNQLENGNDRIGFGAHYDPQILTFLRSNDVAGLEICLRDDETWIPVSSDPSAFYVMVGDIFQVLTNGRFMSIRHRVMANTEVKARISMVYFVTPYLNALISTLPETLMGGQESMYRPFTWGEFKTSMYARRLRLANSRLDLFMNVKP